ncbi:protein shisa-like-1a [Osmerus eperlanus]|uniref:protein shisa-like-1a n=1 Tax=Osmerus eperlanus TaxID=29151 RepID=UPI002E135D3A
MLCEGYFDRWGAHHSGFYCPRLSEPPAQSYCCWLGQGLKQCCTLTLYQSSMNFSQTDTRGSLKYHLDSNRPILKMVIMLYGCLVLVLLLTDFLWFCRARGLTVISVLKNYFTCPHWISGILFPHHTHKKTERCHGDRRASVSLREHKIPRELPCL